MHFLIGLLLRTFEINLKFVVRFLVACLVSEILNDKDTSYPPTCFIIRFIFMTSQPGKNVSKFLLVIQIPMKISENFSTFVRSIYIKIQLFLTMHIFRMCSLKKTNFTLVATSWIF